MPSFSKDSFSALSTAHIDLQTVFYEVIKHIDCKVLQGHRDQAAQEAAFAAGRTTLHYPQSKHNSLPAFAVDVAPYPVDWSNLNRFYWFAGIVLGISEMLFAQGKITHKLRWGGDWNQNYDISDEHGLRDLPHFEIVGS